MFDVVASHMGCLHPDVWRLYFSGTMAEFPDANSGGLNPTPAGSILVRRSARLRCGGVCGRGVILLIYGVILGMAAGRFLCCARCSAGRCAG